MSDSETIETTGVVLKAYGNNNYDVEIEGENGNKRTVLCNRSGKMRKFRINVLAGDNVKVTIPPPYNLGRITFRGKI